MKLRWWVELVCRCQRSAFYPNSLSLHCGLGLILQVFNAPPVPKSSIIVNVQIWQQCQRSRFSRRHDDRSMDTGGGGQYFSRSSMTGWSCCAIWALLPLRFFFISCSLSCNSLPWRSLSAVNLQNVNRKHKRNKRNCNSKLQKQMSLTTFWPAESTLKHWKPPNSAHNKHNKQNRTKTQ